MSNNNDTSGRLARQSSGPVYVTRMVGARLTGVNDRTFEAHAIPDAWRRERDGKLSPLYSVAAVEAFRALYQPQISASAE